MTPLSSTAAIGLALGRERDDPARETEAEGAAVTTRDAAPETENVQDVSDLLFVTSCLSHTLFILIFFFLICNLPSPLLE